MTVTSGGMNFRWIVKGEVAGAKEPDSDEELAFLTREGAKAIVRLQTGPKVTPAQVKAAGFDDCLEPVPDGGAPPPNKLIKIVTFIEGKVNDGKPVVVTCGAGYGRTGTILACYLVKKGWNSEEAIRKVGTLETEEQREAVKEFERTLKELS